MRAELWRKQERKERSAFLKKSAGSFFSKKRTSYFPLLSPITRARTYAAFGFEVLA
jgi:hypothetical protein